MLDLYMPGRYLTIGQNLTKMKYGQIYGQIFQFGPIFKVNKQRQQKIS